METFAADTVEITALVLAAGRGARLHPLTDSRNKCVWPIAGRPAIAYSLDRALAIGADSIVVVVGYRAGDVIEAVGSCHGPLRVRYAYQSECRGVVHAMASARKSLSGGAIFLSPGDEILIEPRLGAMREAFESDPTLLGLHGVVSAGEPDRVRRTGTCLLRNAILDLLPSAPCNPVSGEQELTDLFQHAIDSGHQLPTFDVGGEYPESRHPGRHRPDSPRRGAGCGLRLILMITRLSVLVTGAEGLPAARVRRDAACS